MATTIEAQGHTVDEAIQIALNQLGVSRDKVEIEIVHHPRRGVLGIGARRAKVRATIRENVMLDGEEFDMSGGAELEDKPRRRRRRGGRNRGGGRDDDRPETAPQAAAPRPAAAGGRDNRRNQGQGDRRGDGRRAGGGGDAGRGRGDAGRGDAGRGREDRRGGGGRGRGDQRGDRPAGAEQRADGQQRGGQEQRADNQSRGGQEQRESGRQQPQGDRSSQQRGRQQPQRDQGERRDRGAPDNRGGSDPMDSLSLQAAAPRSDAPRQALAHESGSEPRAARPSHPRRSPSEAEVPLDAAALDAIRARAEELVLGLLSRMGFAAEVTSTIDESAGEAIVSVRSDSEGLLIGRRGQTLDSLEHIVNRMALRGDAYVEGRILLDIGDYRRRRRESLDELASRLRARAVGERRTVQVSPMSPRDRKFLAQAFADDDSVEVRSLGAGFYRRVIVAPAGMGAAAVAEAEATGGGEVETADSGFPGADAES